jgi:hypothetical protein
VSKHRSIDSLKFAIVALVALAIPDLASAKSAIDYIKVTKGDDGCIYIVNDHPKKRIKVEANQAFYEVVTVYPGSKERVDKIDGGCRKSYDMRKIKAKFVN